MALIPKLSAIFIAAALIGPTATIVNARPQDDRHDDSHDRRIYDSEHKDYHNWNKDEDAQWHIYINTNHMKYRDFDKANKKEQSDYWKWRHDHDDHHDDHPR